MHIVFSFCTLKSVEEYDWVDVFSSTLKAESMIELMCSVLQSKDAIQAYWAASGLKFSDFGLDEKATNFVSCSFSHQVLSVPFSVAKGSISSWEGEFISVTFLKKKKKS